MGYLLATHTGAQRKLYLVGPKGLGRFPEAHKVRQVSAQEALQVWGLRIPRTSSACVLRHG